MFIIHLSSLFLILWCPIPSSLIDPGTMIEVENTIVDTAPLIQKFREIMSDGGRQLRVKVNGGCMDAGHRTPHPNGGILTPYVNEKCGLHPWTKWYWNGDYLKTGWTSDYAGEEGCLGFWGKQDVPRDVHQLQVFVCGLVEQFFIRIHPSQLDFSRLEIYFSIHSKKYAKKCLGMYNDDVDVYPDDMKNDTKSLRRDMFQLQECYGFDQQSFYLDSEQFDEIDNLKQKIFGPKGFKHWDYKKEDNCSCVNANAIENQR